MSQSSPSTKDQTHDKAIQQCQHLLDQGTTLGSPKAVFRPQTAPHTSEWPNPYHPSGCGRRSRWDSSLQLQSSCQPDFCGPKPVLALWPKQKGDFNCHHQHLYTEKATIKMTWVSCLNFNTGPKNTVYNNKKAIKRQGARTELCYNIPLSSICVG